VKSGCTTYCHATLPHPGVLLCPTSAVSSSLSSMRFAISTPTLCTLSAMSTELALLFALTMISSTIMPGTFTFCFSACPPVISTSEPRRGQPLGALVTVTSLVALIWFACAVKLVVIPEYCTMLPSSCAVPCFPVARVDFLFDEEMFSDDLNSSAMSALPVRRDVDTAMRLIKLAMVISMLSLTK
jgi:hypothetical protein